MSINVYLVNNDPFGNDLKVLDDHDGGRIVFEGFLDGNRKKSIAITTSSAGYGSINVFNGQLNSWTRSALLSHLDEVKV